MFPQLRFVTIRKSGDFLQPGEGRRPVGGLTSHAQLFSVRCAVIADGCLILVDKERSLIPKPTHHRCHPHGVAETLTGFTRQARYCGSTQSVPVTASQLGYGWLRRLSALCSCLSRRWTEVFMLEVLWDGSTTLNAQTTTQVFCRMSPVN